jgi:hypothetical protein
MRDTSGHLTSALYSPTFLMPRVFTQKFVKALFSKPPMAICWIPRILNLAAVDMVRRTGTFSAHTNKKIKSDNPHRETQPQDMQTYCIEETSGCKHILWSCNNKHRAVRNFPWLLAAVLFVSFVSFCFVCDTSGYTRVSTVSALLLFICWFVCCGHKF